MGYNDGQNNVISKPFVVEAFTNEKALEIDIVNRSTAIVYITDPYILWQATKSVFPILERVLNSLHRASLLINYTLHFSNRTHYASLSKVLV